LFVKKGVIADEECEKIKKKLKETKTKKDFIKLKIYLKL